jgi:hypothetical protein
MSASGRCTCLLFVATFFGIVLLPHSWFGYQWYDSPLYPAFLAIRWYPLAGWAILADVGAVARIAILACAIVAINPHGSLEVRQEIAVAAALILGPTRLLGVRLVRPASSVFRIASRAQFSIGELLLAVGGIAVTVRVGGAMWQDWRREGYPNFPELLRASPFLLFMQREGAFDFQRPGGLDFRLIMEVLMTAVWFASLGTLILAAGPWRLAAAIPLGAILTLFFKQYETAVHGGDYKIVSWEHPAVMALDFYGTQVTFAAVSLMIIRWCGYRLHWERLFPRRTRPSVDPIQKPAPDENSTLPPLRE